MADKGFDIGGLVDNLKSIVNPAGGTPDADPNDVLGVQLADLSELVQGLKAKHDAYSREMSQDLAKINQLFNGAYKSLEGIRNPNAEGEAEAPAPAQASAEPEAPAAEPEAPASEPAAEEPAPKADEASEDK